MCFLRLFYFIQLGFNKKIKIFYVYLYLKCAFLTGWVLSEEKSFSFFSGGFDVGYSLVEGGEKMVIIENERKSENK